MLDIVSPSKVVLISRNLLDHSDPDVKLVVTSCLVELVRITAPESPYDDDVMKVMCFPCPSFDEIPTFICMY
jgi:hypothetical protein